MPHAVVTAVGAALVALVVLDLVATTLTLGEGAGPMTRRLLGPLWRSLLRLGSRGRRSKMLSNAGPALLVLTVLIWASLSWGGWWLVFLGSDSIRSAQTGAPASAWDVAYFAGFAVFTLGVGDFVADSAMWRVMTSVASFAGLALVTLAVTYLLSVISAVVTRRAFATRVSALGASGEEVLLGGWTGGAFSPAFVSYLTGLAGPLATVVQQQLAYPVLHYFRSGTPGESAPVAIAVLEDTLLLLGTVVDPSVAPDPSAIAPVRRIVDRYTRTVGGTPTARSTDEPPPVPSTALLVRVGIPLRADPAAADRLGGDDGRRRRLQQLVHGAGWTWPVNGSA